MKYPPRLHLAHLPTPLAPLRRLSARLRRQGAADDLRIWVKRDDLTGSATTGNKVRKLEFILARAKDEGADTLVTAGAVQSNHCRATALLGAQQGFAVHLLLRADAAPDDKDGNLMLDYLSGARVHYVGADALGAKMDAKLESCADACRSKGARPHIIPIGGSCGTGVWGYVMAAQELAADFAAEGIKPSVICCATGSGGTHAGLIAGAVRHGLDCPVLGIAISDDHRYFGGKVGRDLDDWQEQYGEHLERRDIRVCDDYTCGGYGIASDAIFDLIAELAREEALVLDPVYTGKAFYGMVQEVLAGRLRGDIVFIHSGGIFGLLARRRHYLAQWMHPQSG